ncbi:MAG: hypothetical protein NT010_06795 [Proteobacteria bacterium]|nr:hypothetical protein [Pseudomonadota bacterium]
MKNTLIIMLLLYAVTVNAEQIKPYPVALKLFANHQVEIHDKRGSYLKIVPPIIEYRELTKWDPSEISTSPDKFDAIAIFSCPENFVKEDIFVNFEISAKVGKLKVDKQYGVTDLEYGIKTARWRKHEITKTIVASNLSQKTAQAIKLSDINIKAIQEKYYQHDEWPYQIKVTVWLSCTKCDVKDRIETILDMMPGD